MSFAPGSRLGPYEVGPLIGAGGMGEGYRATDTRLDRTVAIKVLPAELASDPERRERFEREAKTISSLQHPHICTLHDVGHQDGTDFWSWSTSKARRFRTVWPRGPCRSTRRCATPSRSPTRWTRPIARASSIGI